MPFSLLPCPLLAQAATTDLNEDGRVSVTESLKQFLDTAIASMPYLITAVLIVGITWGVALIARAIARRVLKRSVKRESLRDLFLTLIYAGVWVIGLLAATIVTTGLGVGQVVATFGLGSIALGFAFKDIIENFIAGILIMWRFPFENGDFIVVDEITGKVIETELRMTRIMTPDDRLIVLPNALLLTNPVTVLTAKAKRRVTVMCGVAYDEDVDRSRDLIRAAVEACESVDKGHDVQIFAQAFGASSIDFEVTWWCDPTPLAVRRSKDEVVAAVKRKLDDEGVEIPYPYRTLTFKDNSPLPARVSQRADD